MKKNFTPRKNVNFVSLQSRKNKYKNIRVHARWNLNIASIARWMFQPNNSVNIINNANPERLAAKNVKN